MPHASRIALATLTLATSLTACTPGPGGMPVLSTRDARIGPDDGTDSCRQYVVALDSTGNFFGADILKGAAIGAVGGGLLGGIIGGNWRGALVGAAAGAVTGAAVSYWSALQQQHYDQAVLYTRVQGDISNDNAQITRTQYAFDQLMACRFQQASAINAAYRAHQIDRPTAESQMLAVRTLASRDIGLARAIDQHIEQRGQQFTVAADNLAPAASTSIAAATSQAPLQAVVRHTTSLRTSPNDGAPEIASLPAQTSVNVTRTRGNYALVQADTGQTGYAPVGDLAEPGKKHSSRAIPAGPPAAASATTGQTDVATLAGSNAARRDDFAQSVAVSEKAVASGFEVAG